MLTGLFNRTSYTLGHSALLLDSFIVEAKKKGYTHLGICDMHFISLPAFVNGCLKNGITPLIGLEVKCSMMMDTVPFTLFAKDDIGYHQLLRLSSGLDYPNFFNKNAKEPTCTIEEMQKCDHCYIVTYSQGSVFDYALFHQNEEDILQIATSLQSQLKSLVIGITQMSDPTQIAKNNLLKKVLRNTTIQTVAMNKTIYLKEEDEELLSVVNAIFTDNTLDSLFTMKDEGCYLLSKEELSRYYAPEDIENADRLAASISLTYRKEHAHLPKREDAEAYLCRLSEVGLKKRLAEYHLTQAQYQRYRARLHSELETICKMNFANYFLCVFDYVSYAKKQGIWVGPGRGSAVASLVSYAIGITDIDPLPYNLLFERFLNEERKGMPDIDIDFEEERRQEVIRYVTDKYGEENVAGVLTVSYFKGKNLLKSVAKVMSLDSHPSFINLYNTIRQLLKKRINENISLTDLRRQIENLLVNDALRHYYAICERLSGIVAGYGRHNSGVIVSDVRIADVAPVIAYQDKTSNLSQYIQFQEAYLESRGLIKMDFLSLPSAKPLAKMIQNVTTDDPSFRVKNIPLNDPLLYTTFTHDLTLGYFQFDAQSMRSYILPNIQPQNFADLVACNALGRAQLGALVNDYRYYRSHSDKIHYPSMQLKQVLQETYGMLLYQEQVMLVAHIAAGYTMSEADNLRRGIKKKDKNLLQSYEKDFIERCQRNREHPYPYKEAKYLWDNILRFANYGFNKSHAVAYSLIAVWQAYFKIYHTDLYYDTLLEEASLKSEEERYFKEKEAIKKLLREGR